MPRKQKLTMEGSMGISKIATGEELTIQSGGTLAVESGGTLDIESGGVLSIASTAITATAAELNKNHTITAGVASASKVALLGAYKNLDMLAIADGGLALGTNAGTAITATAAELNKLAGSTVSAAELELNHVQVANAVYTIGADAGTTITINIQLNNAAGTPMAIRNTLFAYLSDDANGDSIVATAPSGGWAAGTDGLVIPVIAGKAAFLTSEADGDIDIVITESGTKNLYMIIVLPNGKIVPSTVIAFAA